MPRGISPESAEKKRVFRESLSGLLLQEGAMAVPLTKGKYSLVDAEDYENVMQWNWYARSGGSVKYYATRANRGGKPIQMHNIILSPPEGMEIDHINGDTLDNRRSNLRACIHSHNMRNLPKPSGNTSSPYKGVSWHKHHGCWQAMLKLDYKQKWLGNFSDPVEAAKAYNAAAVQYFGEFAKLNVVEAL